MSKRAKWVRDGSILATRHTEVDLRSTRASRSGEYQWITVKGASDRQTEALAARLLDFLNAARSPGKDGSEP